MDSDGAVRKTIAGAIRQSNKSRAQIAEQMTQYLGRTVTVHQLNDFSAASKGADARTNPARFPASWVEAFCQATSDDRLQRLLVGPRLRALLELAELELAGAQKEQQRAALRRRLLADKK